MRLAIWGVFLEREEVLRGFKDKKAFVKAQKS